MVNSCVPIVVLPFISVPSLPRAGLSAAAPAGSREGSHPAWCPARSVPSFLTPIWPSSEPPTKGNYTTGPDCGCRYCSMAELFQPAPSPAFAHAGTLCSVFNRWRKGTLREINWLPVTGSSRPALDRPGAGPERDVCLGRGTAPRNPKEILCTTLTAVSLPARCFNVGEAAEKPGWDIRGKHFEKFLLLTQGGKKSCHVYPTQKLNPAINCTSN